ncbi:MAG: MATE family efflux transporter [bacterium]
MIKRFLFLVAFINNLGIDASSGYGVANKLVSFIMLIPGSLMQSMSSFVAQNVGAKQEGRALKAMLTGMMLGASIGVVVCLLSFFKGGELSRIFTGQPAYIARSAQYLKGFAVEAIVTSILFSFMGYYNGHGLTLFVMLQGLAQTLLVRLPVSYYMSIQPNASLTNIGLAAPSATIFGILICMIYYFTYFKRHTLKAS